MKVWLSKVKARINRKYARRYLLGSGAILAVSLGLVVVYAQGMRPPVTESESKVQHHTQGAQTKAADPRRDLADTDPVDKAENNQSTPQDSTPPQQSPAPSPKSVSPPPAAPFRVLLVSTYANHRCARDYGYDVITIQATHSITSEGPSDGTPIHWQTEIATQSGVRIDSQGVTSIPQGGRNVQIPTTSTSGVERGDKMRLQITSPNVIASSWYTVPANASCDAPYGY